MASKPGSETLTMANALAKKLMMRGGTRAECASRHARNAIDLVALRIASNNPSEKNGGCVLGSANEHIRDAREMFDCIRKGASDEVNVIKATILYAKSRPRVENQVAGTQNDIHERQFMSRMQEDWA